MKKLLILASLFSFAATACMQSETEKSLKIIDETLDFALEQTKVLYTYLEENEKLHPRTVKDGELVTANAGWWTSGFYPGTMWYLYEYSNDSEARVIAEEMTRRTSVRQYATNDHDVGFQINCSAGNGYRLTNSPEYRSALITASDSLATRFNEAVGCTRSWNNKAWNCPVIIDNMMNMELFCAGAALSENPRTYEMAISHANRTWEALYRDDNSCYHLADFNPETGEIIKVQTHQGYADSSAWARGQAWGLYGYTMMYRFTGDQTYLDHAVAIAKFMIEHPNMPADMVPYWDYDAPNIPEASRDASAAAVMASALVELSTYVDAPLSTQYSDVALTQILSLAAAPYRSEKVGDNYGFVLTNSVGFMAKESEVDAPLTYADYYFIEAMLRIKKLYKGEPVVTPVI